MARILANLGNVVAPSADYPNGRTRDRAGSTAGTSLNEALLGDMIQFFQKMVIDSGITLNDDPDNVTNGFQLYQALQTIAGMNAWLPGGVYTLTAPLGGTIVSSGSAIYNKYRLVGKTLQWQISLSGLEFSGSPAALRIVLPSAISARVVQNPGVFFLGSYGQSGGSYTAVKALVDSPNRLLITTITGAAFANTNNLELHLQVTLELN